MNNPMIPDSREIYSDWFRMVSSVARGQWQLLDDQYQAGLDILNTLGGPKEAEKASDRIRDLESRALERVKKGFPPPPEVYLAQNRAHIDWSRFPEWAWPMDPELFTGTAHEG